MEASLSPDDQVSRTTEAVEAALADEPDLGTVVVYGSAARGRLRYTGELQSDVDIGVAGAAPLSIDRRIELKETLSTGRFLRRDPEFIEAKMLELYDYEAFLEPLVKRIRRERIARFFGV